MNNGSVAKHIYAGRHNPVLFQIRRHFAQIVSNLFYHTVRGTFKVAVSRAVLPCLQYNSVFVFALLPYGHLEYNGASSSHLRPFPGS